MDWRGLRQPHGQIQLRFHPGSPRTKPARLPERPGQPARVPALQLPQNQTALLLHREGAPPRPHPALQVTQERLRALREGTDHTRRQALLQDSYRDQGGEGGGGDGQDSRGHGTPL